MNLGYIVTIKDLTSMAKNKITIIDNYISAIDANKFVDFFNINKSGSEYSTNYGAQDFIDDKELFDLLKKYESKVRLTHISLNNLEYSIYPYAALGFKWQSGWSQHPHIDAIGPGESIEYSCVIYLNDEYDGGEIEFPNQKFIYKPVKFSAIFFPGKGEEYLHQVNKIIGNDRYSLLFLHTPDITKSSKKLYPQQDSNLRPTD